MALSDIHWNKALTALRLRARETSTPMDDLRAMLLLLKEHWELLSDEALLDNYIANRELVELKAARDIQQAELDALNDEINRRK